MKTITKKPITCKRCGKSAKCSCVFDVKTIDFKTRVGVCKKCAKEAVNNGI